MPDFMCPMSGFEKPNMRSKQRANEPTNRFRNVNGRHPNLKALHNAIDPKSTNGSEQADEKHGRNHPTGNSANAARGPFRNCAIFTRLLRFHRLLPSGNKMGLSKI